MGRTDRLVVHHAPLPPARNGIADYTVRVVESLKPHFRQVSVKYNQDAIPLADAPFTSDASHGVSLYQIGNNWQHTRILEQALAKPGVVLLHDLQLYYLYESLGYSRQQMQDLMALSNPALSERSLAAAFEKRPTVKLPYLLCSMLPDLVSRSRKIIVHSRFARDFVIRNLGPHVADKIAVIPHFAIVAIQRDPAQLRDRYGYMHSTPLIVTAGFASRAKGFELVASAVANLRRAGIAALWIHAGDPAQGDLNLYDLARSHPELAEGFIATGYLDEGALDDYVAMADILVNLRFPTVGESSGSLARALTASACVIVSDTGSYAEIPSSAVVHLPPEADGDALGHVLHNLINAPELRAKLGLNAAEYARTTLSLGAYGTALAKVLHEARPKPFDVLRKLTSTAKPSPREHIDWFDVSTPAGAQLLAEAQSSGSDSQLLYSHTPENRQPGSYIGIIRRAE